MKEIIYKFSDGTKKTIEVEDEFYEEYENLEVENKRTERKETRRHISLNYLNEQGIDFESAEGNPEEIIFTKDLQNQVQKAIKTLSSKQQELVKNVYFEGKTLSEIAKEKGISKSAITQQMQVIYKHLKTILKNF